MALALKLSSTQRAWFRLRRSGLVDPFKTPEETARRLVGVQAQLPPAASLAFWNRTKNCDLSELNRARLEHKTLVRIWGQRNTVHIYAVDDWPLMHAALAAEPSRMLRTVEKSEFSGDFKRTVRAAERQLRAGKRLTYKDIKAKRLREGQDVWAVSYVVFMMLVRAGQACHGPDDGSQSTFVHRELWLPDLDWSPPPIKEACAELALRYLATYGPAEARDLGFWYGASATAAKRWIEAAGERCVQVEVDGSPHWCCAADLKDMGAKPPPRSRWPVRLLYRFDPLVLATKDKSWLVDEADYKRVWRPSAHVEAVLLVKGRIAGTWRYDKKAKGLTVKLTPFAPLTPTVKRVAEREASGVAAFFGLNLAGFEVT